MLKAFVRILIVILLTLITQVGGIIWILNFGLYRIGKSQKSRFFRTSSFLILYLIASFFIVPACANIYGRVALPIDRSTNLIPHNLMTPLLNRHYVKPRLKAELLDISHQVNASNKNLKVSYLDANFPFIDGFPLLPHLSHNDGRKVDLCFYYLKDGKEGNQKPANSGYGKYVSPTTKEFNQTNHCKSKGHWQYDFTKYLSLGGPGVLFCKQKLQRSDHFI